jgi:uncharacterized membrane protein
MDNLQSDLEAIRRSLAELTARVYRIERHLQLDPRSVSVPTPVQPDQATSAAPPIPAVTTMPIVVPPLPAASPAAIKSETDLESRIGSHWLNRSGITALLIGVSYFLKFAFDNNWIGPAGRVAIGLLAGIGVVVWSERFRAKGYGGFSYSL